MNDRFKFRVWDKKHNEYIPSNMIGTLLYFGHRDEFHIEFECFSTFADSLIIEQCTGLKDKNGNLIYEGDIVRCSDGNIYNICWSDSAMIMIAVNTTTKIGDAIYKLKRYDDLEIIDNIHEQPEQKD